MRRLKVYEYRTPSGQLRRAVVYHHAEWDEYFVRHWLDGKLLRKALRVADDLADAKEIAEMFVLKGSIG